MMTVKADIGWLALACGILVQGCFYDVDRSLIPEDDAGTDSATDGGDPTDGGDAVGDVSGVVTIGNGLDTASYAVADLYLSFLAECPTGLTPPESYANFVVEDLDFSQPEVSHAFAVHGAPAVQSHLWGFLDSNASVDPGEPAPDVGDAIATSCAEVALGPGDVIEGVDLVLDMTMPDL